MAEDNADPAFPDAVTFSAIIERGQAQVPMAHVFGEFPKRVRLVSDTSMSLLLGIATDAETEAPFLLPYCETRIDGSKPSSQESMDESEPLMAETLTLENTAFLIVNLASDMASACAELSKLGNGQLRPEPMRLEQARYLMAHVVNEGMRSVAHLSRILAQYETVASDPPSPR